MRCAFPLLFYCNVVGAFGFGWKWFGLDLDNAQDEYEPGFTGRVFVTMMGFPPRCENQGISHACTLSLACWWVGGSSEEGCGASRWLVSCCVTYSSKHSQLYVDEDEYHEYQGIESKEIATPILQKRNNYLEDECGMSSDRVLLKRIIGGNQAKFGQFPWQAYLKITGYQCGGVLVSRRFVATAAHCILKARMKDIQVYLGELDTQNGGKVLEFAPEERHKVRRKIIHPQFRFRITQPDRYDLALLELDREARDVFHITPICLPEGVTSLLGQKAVVAGWGKTKPSADLTGTTVLRSAEVPILDIKECMSWHRIKQIHVELYEDMLCAGYRDGHKDSCLGDSGGPLIALINGRWTLVGIISAGFGCGQPNQPGIYHSVLVTSDWIRSVIRS